MNNRLSSISYLELQSLIHKRDLNHLGFSDLEKLECSFHSQNADFPEKNKVENSESTDTLQSLVQSCSCRKSRSHENSIPSRGEDIQECKLHQPQERLRNLLITYQKNVGIENYYYSKPQLEKKHPFSSGGTKLIDSASGKEGKNQKKRIRWTEDLHKKFIECVDSLGGSKKATPKGILKLMKCDGLTIFHVKSHLQKYRGTELIPEEKEGNSDHQLGLRTGMQIAEAIRLQIDVQQRLFDQLESQKNLQKRIEEQARQLQTMLECQQKLNNTS